MNRIYFVISLLIVSGFFFDLSIAHGEDILLMFPKAKEEIVGKQKTRSYKIENDEAGNFYSEIEFSKFINKFQKKEYKIMQIELWIEAKTETEGVTKLFVSLEGKGGCKLILKPNN